VNLSYMCGLLHVFWQHVCNIKGRLLFVSHKIINVENPENRYLVTLHACNTRNDKSCAVK